METSIPAHTLSPSVFALSFQLPEDARNAPRADASRGETANTSESRARPKSAPRRAVHHRPSFIRVWRIESIVKTRGKIIALTFSTEGSQMVPFNALLRAGDFSALLRALNKYYRMNSKLLRESMFLAVHADSLLKVHRLDNFKNNSFPPPPAFLTLI